MPTRIIRGLTIVGLGSALLACGAEPREDAAKPGDSEARAEVDSLRAVVAELERELSSTRSALREAGRAGSDRADQATDATPSDSGAPADAAIRFQGPVASELATSLLRFAGERGATITYVGAVRDGKADGLGYGVWSTGSAYEGQWRANKRHGAGRHTYPDGAVYEGRYSDDLREGPGTYHYKDGQRWEGPWQQNLRHGEGVLYEADGRVRVRGVWERDRLIREIKD